MPFNKGQKSPGKTFAPRQSGNPGGLPKGIERDMLKEFRTASELGGQEGVAALRSIVAKAQINPKYWNIAIRARALLLSWGYSKPPQLQDTTVSAKINNRYAVSFEVSNMDVVIRGMQHVWPTGVNFAYVAPTQKQAKLVAWPYLKAFAAPFLSDARIQVFGAESAENLRGIGLSGVVLDEFAGMPPSVWSEIVRPMLSDRGGWCRIIGEGTKRVLSHLRRGARRSRRLDGQLFMVIYIGRRLDHERQRTKF